MTTRAISKSRRLPAETSGDRLLAVLALFTVAEPEWTVGAAARRLRISNPTAYRYFKSLARVGLIASVSRASYVLGPAITELDRQIRLCDPLLIVSRPVMDALIRHAAEGATILLCRAFKDRVVCIHQVVGRGPQAPISYERGRPMPLFRGATSKIILAHLPLRTRQALYAAHAREARSAGLGATYDQFARSLRTLRRTGAAVTSGEVDRGRVGIAAPVFGAGGMVLGSLTFVLPTIRASDALVARLRPLTIAAARAIEQAMAAHEKPMPALARRKGAR